MALKNSSLESPDELFILANRKWSSGDAKAAFKLFLQAAAAGNVPAKNSVGYFLDHGTGVRRNSALALRWYSKAARHGDLSAYSNVATSHRNRGNARQARIWFQKAAEKGEAGASVDLAELLLETNRKDNITKAVRKLQAAVRSRYISDDERHRATSMLEKLKV